MNEHELLQKAFSNLHASGNTLQDVMSRVHNVRDTKGISKRFAVLVAIVVMLYSMVLVVHATSLLADLVAISTPVKNPSHLIYDAYSDSVSVQKPIMLDGYGNLIVMPAMERPVIDLAEAERMLGPYISNVDRIISIGENTFTIKNFLIDETGSGVLTWIVENPNDITYEEAGYGVVYSTSFGDLEICQYSANGQKKGHVAMSTALISKNADSTKLELVTYFGTSAKYEIGDSFILTVDRGIDGEKQNIQITPAEHVPTKTMTAEDGVQLTISNYELTVDIDSENDFVTSKIVIHYKDGTQYRLEDDREVYNLRHGFFRRSESYTYDDMVCLFNRVIDTDQVASVEVVGVLHEVKFNGTANEYTPHSKHYIFYP